jgi:hypothetical protein
MTALYASGCATLISGRYQQIRVASTPDDATVSVQRSDQRGKPPVTYQTPAEIRLRRKETAVVLRVEKEGYQPQEIELRRTTNSWILLNVANPMWLGLAITDGSGGARAAGVAAYLGVFLGVDLLTGAAYHLGPGKIQVQLERAETGER